MSWRKLWWRFSHVYFIIISFSQVFLLLVKRLASLHYNTHQDNPKSFRLPSSPPSTKPQQPQQQSKTTINCCSDQQAIKDCGDIERDDNLNRTITKYDESTSDSNYKEPRINETTDNNNSSSRSEENMGSNVSTSGGKGLSGRRTQSSSELNKKYFSFDHFMMSKYHWCWHDMTQMIRRHLGEWVKPESFEFEFIFPLKLRKI